MATGGCREYELFALDPSIQEDRSQDGERVCALTLQGSQVYKRVGDKAAPEDKRRNVPIFLTNSYINFLKKQPVFWITRDLGLAYIFYHMDFIELQSMGYAFAPLFGKTGLLEHDFFPGYGVRLGPNFSILNRSPEERQMMTTKAEIEGAREARLLVCNMERRLINPGTPEEQAQIEDNYDSGEEYDPNCKLTQFLKMHSRFRGNQHSHGLAIAYDERKERYTYTKGQSPDTYNLYLIPGRDEVIEASQPALEYLMPEHQYFKDFEHFGLALLRLILDSTGRERRPGGNFRFVMVYDTPQAYYANLIHTINTNYSRCTNSTVEVQFLTTDGTGHTKNISLELLQDQESLATNVPFISIANFKAAGYRHWSQTPITSPERNPARQQYRGAGNITFNPTLVDTRPEQNNWESYLARLLEINEAQEELNEPARGRTASMDAALRSDLAATRYKKLTKFILKAVVQQAGLRANPQELAQLKLQQANELAAICHEGQRAETERRKRHLERFDRAGCLNEIAELERQLQNPQYYLSSGDCEALWQEGIVIAGLIREEFDGFREMGYTEGPSHRRIAFLRDNVFNKQGINRIYRIRERQLQNHKSGLCGQNPCRH